MASPTPPRRTRRELADHTDRCWSNKPGSRDTDANRFIDRLHRRRQLLHADNQNADYRPEEPAQPTTGWGTSMIDTGENPRSAASAWATVS